MTEAQFTYTPPMISINATYHEGSPLDSLTIELNGDSATTEVFDAMVNFIATLSEKTGLTLDRVAAEFHDNPEETSA